MIHRKQLFAIAVLLTAPLIIGCQQTNGTINSPLTPVGAFSGVDPLSPVQQGVRTTSGVGPLGGPTRVTPPATRGYSVPNNYLGGLGQASHQAAPNQETFANQSGQTGSGWVQSGQLPTTQQANGSTLASTPTFGQSFANQNPTGQTFAANSVGPQNSGQPNSGQSNSVQRNPLQASVARPQSGGMRVIDMTGSPAPPNYQPVAGNPSATFQSPNGNVVANGFAPNTFSQPANTVPQINVAPASFQTPAPAREFPMNESPTAPDFNGSANFAQQSHSETSSQASRFEPSRFESSSSLPTATPRPSTEPIDVSQIPADDGLSWRRPF